MKALFDDARSNATVPLTARFVRNVRHFLDEHVQMSIHDKVLAQGLIPQPHMKAFMHALINGKLDVGTTREHAAQQAVASFVRMTLTPQELHLHCAPTSPELQRAAMTIGIYDMRQNEGLMHVLDTSMAKGESSPKARQNILDTLHKQFALLLELYNPQSWLFKSI